LLGTGEVSLFACEYATWHRILIKQSAIVIFGIASRPRLSNLKTRDQVAAHFPANAMPYGSDGPPANSVWLVITNDNQKSLGVYELHLSATAISDTIALSNILIEGTLAEVTSIWTRLNEQRLIPTFPGEYLMDPEKAEFTPMSIPRD
jgi:hypothetical protein